MKGELYEKNRKKGNHLAVKMAIAMVLGLICGLAMLMLRENLLTSGQTQTWAAINNLLFQDITAEAGKNAIGLFYIVGQLFVNALQVIIVPMIFCSIALAICQITDTRKLGRISSKTLGTFLLTTVVALVIAGAVGLTVYATGAFNAVEVSGLNVSTGVQRKQSAVNLVVNRSEQHDQCILNQRTSAGGGVLSGSDGVGHQRPGFQGNRFKEAAAGNQRYHHGLLKLCHQ